QELLTLSQQFFAATHLEFYTDGSLMGLDTLSMRMSMVWLQTNLCSPMVSFSSALVTTFTHLQLRS
ncbi:8787_t:CDS:1, partial [Funneliformis caledonium]